MDIVEMAKMFAGVTVTSLATDPVKVEVEKMDAVKNLGCGARTPPLIEEVAEI